MRRTAHAVAVAALLLGAAAHAEAQRHRPPAAQTGRLLVISQNQGATVYVDEQAVGSVPIEPQTLPAGDHTLRVTLAGFTDYTDVVTIRGGQDTSAEVELFAVTSVLHVATTPDRAQTFVDDRFAGDTPLDTELLEGPHHVRIHLLGFYEETRDVTGVPGQRVSLELQLRRLPADQDPTRAHQHWYDNPWTWIGVGAGVVALALIVVIIAVATSSGPSAADNFCKPDPMHCIVIHAF